uniref:DUF2793 domain-containing protein n=1 Tax=Brevundimonas sp. TaxID=1871086 RepID=UPI0035AE90FE
MSEDQSARLGLPYLAAGQMQKHVTLNEALTRLDALVQLRVESRSTAEPPADPQDGRLYIVPDGGDWPGFTAGDLVRAENGVWSRIETPPGALAWIGDAGRCVVREGAGWTPLGERLGEIRDLERFGLGATPDGANPFLVRLNNALWTAREAASGGNGDLRLVLNKAAPDRVLSLLLQSGWNGRAELGLVGDDDFALKVGDDGGQWREVFRVDRFTGRAAFPAGALRREMSILTADAAWQPPAWARTVEAVLVGAGGGGGAGAFGISGDRFGGGGGGAGGVANFQWRAEDVAAGLTVVVGAGGAGGLSAAGQAGGDTRILLGPIQLAAAGGGGGGSLGDASGGAGGSGGAGLPRGHPGGASEVATAAGAGEAMARPDGPGGGGAGGGLDASGIARSGGAGGDGAVLAALAGGGSGGPA